MGTGNFSDEFKRDAVAQITERVDMSFNPNAIKAVNMDAFYAEDGSCTDAWPDHHGGRTDRLGHQPAWGKVIMQALTEFIEAAEGKRNMTRTTEQ